MGPKPMDQWTVRRKWLTKKQLKALIKKLLEIRRLVKVQILMKEEKNKIKDKYLCGIQAPVQTHPALLMKRSSNQEKGGLKENINRKVRKNVKRSLKNIL